MEEDVITWAGEWAGSVVCESWYEAPRDEGSSTRETSASLEFDVEGHLLFPDPLTHEGQTTEWQEGGDGIGRRELKRFVDEGNHRFYRIEQTIEKPHLEETLNIELDLWVVGKMMRYDFAWDAYESVTLPNLDGGTRIEETVRESHCNGVIRRWRDAMGEG